MTTSGPPAHWVSSDLLGRLVTLRRALHRRPELSWEERETAARIASELSSLGVPFRSVAAGTGVIAELPGPRGVPAVALRADLDALPIAEATGLSFQSERPGIMHACGHDLHAAMLIGAAALLTDEHSLPAPVRLLFQPAEEIAAGARAMIDLGAVEGVGMIFGGHVDVRYPVGHIAIHEGTVNASTDEFTIELSGPGGHAARPEESVDPIVAAAALVLELQALVEHLARPGHPAIVSVGQIHGGTASNILASSVRLDGTLRAHSATVFEKQRTVLAPRRASTSRPISARERQSSSTKAPRSRCAAKRGQRPSDRANCARSTAPTWGGKISAGISSACREPSCALAPSRTTATWAPPTLRVSTQTSVSWRSALASLLS